MTSNEKLLAERVWYSMGSFPKDGTVCDILLEGGVVVQQIHWGLPPIGSTMTFVGSQNILSPYLLTKKMVGWREHVKGDTPNA